MLRNIVLGAAVAFVVAGLAFFYLYQEQESQPLEVEFEPDLGGIPTVVVTDSGNPVPSPGNCDNLPSQYEKNLCWGFQAGLEQNVRLCDNIVPETRPNNTVDESDKVVCIEAVARELLDPSICEQEFIGNTDRRYHCLTQIARDEGEYDLCNRMPQPYKDKCIRAVDDELAFLIT